MKQRLILLGCVAAAVAVSATLLIVHALDESGSVESDPLDLEGVGLAALPGYLRWWADCIEEGLPRVAVTVGEDGRVVRGRVEVTDPRPGCRDRLRHLRQDIAAPVRSHE